MVASDVCANEVKTIVDEQKIIDKSVSYLEHNINYDLQPMAAIMTSLNNIIEVTEKEIFELFFRPEKLTGEVPTVIKNIFGW